MQLAFLKALIASLVLIWYHPDGRFIVTADSREVLINNGGSTYDDNACKLVNAGRIVFFETGYPKAFFEGKTIYDGEVVARHLLHARREMPPTKQEVDSIADLWAKQMKAGVENYLKIETAQRLPGGSIGVFLASVKDGTTYGTIRHLELEPNGEILVDSSPMVRGFIGIGDHDGNRIANRRLADNRSRHVLDENPVQLLFQVETNTVGELKSPGVGGKIDEIVISPNRVAVWIHRKANCQ